VVLAADDVPLLAPEALSDHLEKAGEGVPVRLKVQRGSQTLEVTVRSERPVFPKDFPEDEKRAMVGIEWERSGRYQVDHPGPLQQVTTSVRTMVNTFAALLTPSSDVKPQHLSGFVGIMRIYYVLFEDANGWRQAIWFSVILNVNLALLNLLPIPVLDGGHILLAIIEGLRRRPIPAKALALVQTACAVLIIGYIAYVTFFDVQDLPVPWGEKPGQIHFQAPAAPPP
jgi:regulator of sigma E protease